MTFYFPLRLWGSLDCIDYLKARGIKARENELRCTETSGWFYHHNV